MLVSILSNTVILAYYHFMIPEDEHKTLLNLDKIFIIIFTLEAILKIAAQNFNLYFADRWN